MEGAHGCAAQALKHCVSWSGCAACRGSRCCFHPSAAACCQLATHTAALPAPAAHPQHPCNAVLAKLPNLQSLMLPHNKLGGALSCGLLASGKLAALDVTGSGVFCSSVRGPLLSSSTVRPACCCWCRCCAAGAVAAVQRSLSPPAPATPALPPPPRSRHPVCMQQTKCRAPSPLAWWSHPPCRCVFGV